MEKILLLVDALNFKGETLDFAAYISKSGKAKIVGIFVENQVLETAPSVKTIGGTAYVEEIVLDTEEQKRQNELLQKNIAAFKSGCIQREVMAVVHQDPGDPFERIIEESRYADLIIADPSFSFDGDTMVPSEFIMEILGKAECPVLIAPEDFETIDEIVMAYDGSRSAAFAIRQFYYQLPKFSDKRMTVLHIHKNEIKKDSKENALLKEWLDMHFSKVSFLELTGDVREVLFEYFMTHSQQNNKLLVTGAFGRNFISTFFKPSAAELVLKAIDIPIFITHH